MPTTTTNYGWTKPTIGGDSGNWGNELNTTLDSVDTTVKAVSDVANAALPAAGGVMTGRLDAKVSSGARVDKGSISGAQSFDLSGAQYFTYTVGGALTPSFTNVAPGTVFQGMIHRIVNGGSAAISWPASVKWPSGSAPSLTAAGTDLVAFITDDNGATWRGFVLGKDIH